MKDMWVKQGLCANRFWGKLAKLNMKQIDTNETYYDLRQTIPGFNLGQLSKWGLWVTGAEFSERNDPNHSKWLHGKDNSPSIINPAHTIYRPVQVARQAHNASQWTKIPEKKCSSEFACAVHCNHIIMCTSPPVLGGNRDRVIDHHWSFNIFMGKTATNIKGWS